jgi:hypothetical protein
MYGYGYRYPKVKRRLEHLYDDPDYKVKWARAADLNKTLDRKNPWITHLKDKGYLEQVKSIMQKAAAEYRATHPSSEKYKTALSRRLARIEKAAKDYLTPEILATLPQQKFTDADVQAVLNDIEKEIKAIRSIIGAQPVIAKGYGYGKFGLGHHVGEGYFY